MKRCRHTPRVLRATHHWAILGPLGLLGLALLAGCHRSPPPPGLAASAQLEPTAPLTVKVGDKVSWSFRSVAGGPALTVFAIEPDTLPFGLILSGADTPKVAAAGTVLGNQYRSGSLLVRARDLKACEAGVKSTMSLTAKNLTSGAAKEASVPYVTCEDFRTWLPPFDATQTFYWQLADVPEASGDSHSIQALAARSRCLAREDCPDDAVYRPVLQVAIGQRAHWRRLAVAVGPFVGGTCASDDANACRQLMPRCVWALDRCVERRLYP